LTVVVSVFNHDDRRITVTVPAIIRRVVVVKPERSPAVVRATVVVPQSPAVIPVISPVVAESARPARLEIGVPPRVPKVRIISAVVWRIPVVNIRTIVAWVVPGATIPIVEIIIPVIQLVGVLIAIVLNEVVPVVFLGNLRI